MCCWPVATVELEEAPPKKEEKPNYILVSDKLNLEPIREESAAPGAPTVMAHHCIYNPAPAPAHQSAAANPWDDPQPAQVQAAAHHAPRDLSHHCIYNPAPAPTPQPAAPNPWNDPAPAQQQAAPNPWNDPPLAQAPVVQWANVQHQGAHHVAYPVFCAVYPLLLAPPPAAMHYPGHTGVQFYRSAPAPEPHNHVVYQGRPADGNGHNNAQAHYGGHGGHGGGGGNPNPIQLVPRNPSPDDQFYCRELDSSYSLRTGNTIMRDCQPGYWDHGSSGYPYWVRTV